MKLFTGPLSMFGAKAQIAALEKKLAFELIMVPFDRNDAYEPKHPDVARINPKRQVPVLIHGDVELFDSTQIFEYLEDLRRHCGQRMCLRERVPASSNTCQTKSSFRT